LTLLESSQSLFIIVYRMLNMDKRCPRALHILPQVLQKIKKSATTERVCNENLRVILVFPASEFFCYFVDVCAPRVHDDRAREAAVGR